MRKTVFQEGQKQTVGQQGAGGLGCTPSTSCKLSPRETRPHFWLQELRILFSATCLQKLEGKGGHRSQGLSLVISKRIGGVYYGLAV